MPPPHEAAFRDGWFRTGDLGYLDRDGYLFIVGRIKDVINRGGQKVAPGDVEEALLSHPDVVEAVAFPVSHRRLGEDVAAAVVLRPERQGQRTEASSISSRERLARFKVPGLIRFVPEIPKGPERKDQARRTGRRRFNDRAKRERRTRRQDSSATLGIGTAAGRDLGGTAGARSDWG